MVIVVGRKCSLAQVQLYMSQAFEEIWHLQKSLGDSRDAWIFLNCLALAENVIYLTMLKFWEMAQYW